MRWKFGDDISKQFRSFHVDRQTDKVSNKQTLLKKIRPSLCYAAGGKQSNQKPSALWLQYRLTWQLTISCCIHPSERTSAHWTFAMKHAAYTPVNAPQHIGPLQWSLCSVAPASWLHTALGRWESWGRRFCHPLELAWRSDRVLCEPGRTTVHDETSWQERTAPLQFTTQQHSGLLQFTTQQSTRLNAAQNTESH